VVEMQGRYNVNPLNVLETGSDQTSDLWLWAIEIKRTTAPEPSRGFHLACDDIKPSKKWVVYAGEEEYQMKDGIIVTPLIRMMSTLQRIQHDGS